jgi:hypothetical protein
MDIEENDEVEKEIDIVYSGQFSNESKLFQFPLVPKSSMNIENINSLSMSKDNMSMKMKLNIDKKYLDKNDYNAVPISFLKGEKIENNSNICIGFLKNDKLYLTSISQIFQFRQDFSNRNREKNVMIKKDRKDSRNPSFKIEEKIEEDYMPLTINQPNSIDSKIMIERIAQPGEMKNANFMKKEEYFDFLFKYVISPESGGDSNEDYLSLYKNNSSKESFVDNIPEVKNEEDNMIIEKENENKKEIKKSNLKSKGFNVGIESIKNNNNEKNLGKVENGNSFVCNIINNIYEENKDNESLYYNDLLTKICQKMSISNDDEEKIEQIKNEIEKNCIIVKENICFVKSNGDDNVQKVRNFLIKEIGNMDNGMKKQQIKELIKQNGLSISDNKLTNLLKKICKNSGNLWVIKSPN